MSAPFALTAYRVAGRALRPLAGAWLHLRSRSGKEDPDRLSERFGRSALTRPDGVLVWLHGASVGETRVLLALRDAMAEQRPDLHFLITTGTRTSAEIVAKDAHPRTQHQFAVVDTVGPVGRFLDHWRPDLGVFAESEVWPTTLMESKARKIPLALINACMGEKSIAGWTRARESAQTIFNAFDLILAADRITAQGLESLTCKPVPAVGNLKLAAGLPACDKHELAEWRARLSNRPVWIAASTHDGEDDIVIEAQAALRWRRDGALLIIAPRHPARGEAIAARAGGAPRRSQKQVPSASDSIYVADTLGEMGLWFALAPVTLMAGSLIPPLEGHNPVEPSLAGSAVISGPFVSSFAEVYGALDAAGGLSHAGDAASIAARVEALWSNEAERLGQVVAARDTLKRASPGLERTVTELLALMAPARADVRLNASA